MEAIFSSETSVNLERTTRRTDLMYRPVHNEEFHNYAALLMEIGRSNQGVSDGRDLQHTWEN